MELWDIYDSNKNKTGKVIARNNRSMLKVGEYHLVVEAVIINPKGEILLGKRASSKEKFPLMWECCGGACIKGETSLQGILREIKEELGLEFKEKDAIFYKTIKDDEAKDFKDIWLFKGNIFIEDIKFADGEVIDVKWVTEEKFKKMCKEKEIVPTNDFTIEDYEKSFNLLYC